MSRAGRACSGRQRHAGCRCGRQRPPAASPSGRRLPTWCALQSTMLPANNLSSCDWLMLSLMHGFPWCHGNKSVLAVVGAQALSSLMQMPAARRSRWRPSSMATPGWRRCRRGTTSCHSQSSRRTGAGAEPLAPAAAAPCRGERNVLNSTTSRLAQHGARYALKQIPVRQCRLIACSRNAARRA